MRRVAAAVLAAALLVPVPAPARTTAPFSFAANTRKPGVRQTKSGLQYRVIKPGRGASPLGTEVALVTYAGRFPDGRMFDESKQPVALPLNKVIKGFGEGLGLMRKGATYRFWIPPSLGYGAKEMRNDDGTVAIPANSILVFDVTLVDILPPSAPATILPTR